MKLKLVRKYKLDTYTIGKLYIDGIYFCDTLEDKDRGLTSDMSLSEIQSIKIKGNTCIPYGQYQVTLKVNVKSPNRLIIAPEFKSERHIIIYTKKEYKNKRSKIFFIRWFQNKINVAYITLEEKNPYIDVKQQKLVKIIK